MHRCPLCGELFAEPVIHEHQYGFAYTIPVEDDDE